MPPRIEDVAIGDGVAAVVLGRGAGGTDRDDAVGRSGRAVTDVAMVNRIVVIAIRPRGGTEVNHGTRENGVHAPECGVAEGIVAGFVDETHRHTAGAGVGDGELRCRADAAPGIAPHAARPPVDGDILSAVQIDRRCRGVGTGQGDRRHHIACRTKCQRIDNGRAQAAEDQRVRLDRTDIVRLQFKRDGSSQPLTLNISNCRSDRCIVIAGRTNRKRPDQRSQQGSIFEQFTYDEPAAIANSVGPASPFASLARPLFGI